MAGALDYVMWAALTGTVERAGAVALRALLPPQCMRCGELVDSPGTLCGACWSALSFLGPPQCQACGYPFEFDSGARIPDDTLCGQCLGRRPIYGRARAVLRYDDSSRPLVLAFKHGDRTDAAPAFGRMLVRAGAEILAGADLVVPVPLHWTRLFRRRYNQAALLAHAVARASGVPAGPDLLVRVRRTPSQGRLAPPERRRNVRGAFAVRRGGRTLVEG
ncbi:MAG: ComF family protein, partial [Alphaproteobacteria bacterium]